MAQIKTRYTKTGDPRFTAYIRKKRKGVVIHEESQTFPTRPQAVLWAKRREVELAEPDALAVARMGERSIGALITRYIEEFEQIEGEDGAKKWGRTKSADLRKLLNYGIANHDALTLTSSRLVEHIKERRAEGVGTATNDLIETYDPSLEDAIGGTVAGMAQDIEDATTELLQGQYEASYDSLFGMPLPENTSGDFNVTSSMDYYYVETTGC